MEERLSPIAARELLAAIEAHPTDSEAEAALLRDQYRPVRRRLVGSRKARGALALAGVALVAAALVARQGAGWWLRASATARLGAAAVAEEVSPAEDLCGKVENDVEYHTSQSLYWVSNIASKELCCAECNAVPECEAWTYGTDEAIEGVSRHCYLKKLAEGEEPQRFNRSGLISGVLLHRREKHGVVSNLLSKKTGDHTEPDIVENQTCPGDLLVKGYGNVSLIAAKMHSPEKRGGVVEVPYTKWAVIPHLKGRAYFGDSCTVSSTGQYARKEYAAMRLLGHTLRYTVDLSRVGCGCNAQLHLVPLRQNRKEGKCGDYFCGHGFQRCGVSCTEIGIQDANQYAWSTNLHLHDDSAGPASGYGGGVDWVGRRDWDERQYGPGGECVDTTWPFDVEVSFPTWGSGLLKAVVVTLSQEGRSCPLTVSLDKYHFHGRNGMVELTSILKGGVTPVIQYWSSPNFEWLDGAGSDGKGPCVEDAPRACPSTVRFYDFVVSEGMGGAGAEARHEEGSVLMTAIDLVHKHTRQSADAEHNAEVQKLEKEQEEKKIDELSNASKHELNILRDGKAVNVSSKDAEGEAEQPAETGSYMEWQDGNAEWEVVCETLFIRNGSSFEADILGTKVKGEVLIGKRSGDWIELAHEHGYTAISQDGTALLRERIVEYLKVAVGSCASAGMFPIEDASSCMAAGFALGYFDTSVHVSVNSDVESPDGCYLQNGQLFVSVAKANKGNGVVDDMQPICASLAYPTTTTTTETSTTTTTSTTSTTSTSTTTVTTVTSTSTTTWGFPSLFCIEVVRVHGYELPLVKAQQSQGASIFGCEEYAVFSDGGIPKKVGVGPDGKDIMTTSIPKIKEAVGDLSKGATTNSWLNTKTFLQVWDLCEKDGRYKKHDWVVKVDPDAVFFPERLRTHMKLHTLKNAKLFVMNCARYNPVALYGSVEIFSKAALDAYLAGQWNCRNNLPWHGWGEDFFMSHCMDMLGVGRIYDFDLLSDKRCIYRPCSDPSRAVYHDYKDASLDGTWFKCWRESQHR